MVGGCLVQVNRGRAERTPMEPRADDRPILLSREIQRGLFLAAVEKHVPEVLVSLRNDVLPTFKSLFKRKPIGEEWSTGEVLYPIRISSGLLEEYFVITWHCSPKTLKEHLERRPGPQPSWTAEFGGEQTDPKRAIFRTKTLAWAARWDLADPWILDHVLGTLLYWLQHPDEAASKWAWVGRYSIGGKDFAPPLLTINEQWRYEPWDRFAGRVQAVVDAYKATIDEFCDRIGYDPPPRGTQKKAYRYDWLALYQCRKASPRKIQNWHFKNHDEQVVESTVTKAIHLLAPRIGLTLRPRQVRQATRVPPRAIT